MIARDQQASAILDGLAELGRALTLAPDEGTGGWLARLEGGCTHRGVSPRDALGQLLQAEQGRDG